MARKSHFRQKTQPHPCFREKVILRPTWSRWRQAIETARKSHFRQKTQPRLCFLLGRKYSALHHRRRLQQMDSPQDQYCRGDREGPSQGDPSQDRSSKPDARNAVGQQVSELDRKVMKLARHDAQVRRFTTAPGSVRSPRSTPRQRLTIARFARSRSVGAYVGLTSRRHASGSPARARRR